MAKLLDVDLKVQLPKGSTYADVRVEFESEGYYTASTVVGGDLIGKTTAPDADGIALVKGPDGVAALKVYGGEVGDDMPPLVSLRIIPRGAGIRAVPWVHKGHPRDTGNGKWDGSKFGIAAGERISTEAERQSLEQRIAAADAATGELAAKKAEVDQGLADNAQDKQLSVQTRNQLTAEVRNAYQSALTASTLATGDSVATRADLPAAGVPMSLLVRDEYAIYSRAALDGVWTRTMVLPRQHETTLARNQGNLPPGIFLRYDDGWLTQYTVAHQHLRKYPQLRANIAVVPTFLGGGGMMSEAQLMEMYASGQWEFMSHSWSHTEMTNKPDIASLRAEFADSKAWIEARTGVPCRTFVYPRGWYDLARTVRIAREYYDLQLTTDAESVNPESDLIGVLPDGAFTYFPAGQTGRRIDGDALFELARATIKAGRSVVVYFHELAQSVPAAYGPAALAATHNRFIDLVAESGIPTYFFQQLADYRRSHIQKAVGIINTGGATVVTDSPSTYPSGSKAVRYNGMVSLGDEALEWQWFNAAPGSLMQLSLDYALNAASALLSSDAGIRMQGYATRNGTTYGSGAYGAGEQAITQGGTAALIRPVGGATGTDRIYLQLPADSSAGYFRNGPKGISNNVDIYNRRVSVIDRGPPVRNMTPRPGGIAITLTNWFSGQELLVQEFVRRGLPVTLAGATNLINTGGRLSSTLMRDVAAMPAVQLGTRGVTGAKLDTLADDAARRAELTPAVSTINGYYPLLAQQRAAPLYLAPNGAALTAALRSIVAESHRASALEGEPSTADFTMGLSQRTRIFGPTSNPATTVAQAVAGGAGGWWLHLLIGGDLTLAQLRALLDAIQQAGVPMWWAGDVRTLTPNNVLANGDFAGALDGWATVASGGTATTGTVEGRSVLTLTSADANGYAYAMQSIPVPSGATTVNAELVYKCPAGQVLNSNSRIAVRVVPSKLDGTNQLELLPVNAAPPAADWTTATGSAALVAGAVRATVYVRNWATGATADIDSVRVWFT